MPKKTPKNPADFIAPLNINGLNGRMLRMPPPKGVAKEILFVYGHHSSLERWWGLTQVMNRYAGVTMPDLPGFGNMDSFYKIGKKPTIDNLADYLAAFIKMRYKRKKVTIVGMSFGFVVATRMLQRYPELTKKVDMLASIAGFSHKDDFVFSKPRWLFYRYTTAFFQHRIPALFFRYVVLNPVLLKIAYRRTHNAKHKFTSVLEEEIKEITEVEIRLWHENDVRTYMKTSVEFLTLNNCDRRVDLPVYHVSIEADRYFDPHIVEQHLRVIFNDYELLTTLKVGNHAPSIIADAKAAAPYFPPKLRRLLTKK